MYSYYFIIIKYQIVNYKLFYSFYYICLIFINLIQKLYNYHSTITPIIQMITIHVIKFNIKLTIKLIKLLLFYYY
jgi:hypothetical protein